VPTRDNGEVGNNKMRYRSAALDALLEKGRRELDRERRKAIYADVQRLLARDLPIVPLWHEDNIVVRRREVRGFQILPTAQLSSLARTYKER
jgi:peptide/nickel transport system substrate-binding protein